MALMYMYIMTNCTMNVKKTCYCSILETYCIMVNTMCFTLILTL